MIIEMQDFSSFDQKQRKLKPNYKKTFLRHYFVMH